MHSLITLLRRPEMWRPVRPRTWWFDAVLVAAFVAATTVVWQGWTDGLDEAVARYSVEHFRSVPAWYGLLSVLNLLGQGWMITWLLGGVLTLLVLWRIRSWRAVLPWVCTFALTYLTVGPLKVWTARLAPTNPRSNAVELFNPYAPVEAYALSYPSGHVVNTIVWWGTIAVLAGVLIDLTPTQLRWIRILPPVVVLMTTTLTAFHWVTDGIAALALGLLLSRLLQRVNWPWVLRATGSRRAG